MKPLYGLDDASRKFWLKVRETLSEFGLRTMPGDEVFYFKNTDGKLIGAILSHVDDFIVTGEKKFVEQIVEGIKSRMTVSKVEESEFRFTGLDVKVSKEGIKVSMDEYADSVEEVEEIRKAHRSEELTKIELKEYRKYSGKMSWLSQGARPDLSYTALQMSKRNNSATIADLRNINKVIEKVKKEKKCSDIWQAREKRKSVVSGTG